MTDINHLNHGALTVTRMVNADQATAFDAWTLLNHRAHWFAGPEWMEIERGQDFRVGGTELAHGRFPDGRETCYSATYHLIEPTSRVIYSFAMNVDGAPFSVSLAGVTFDSFENKTRVTYTEQGFFLGDNYSAESRRLGTEGLLEQFATYVESLD